VLVEVGSRSLDLLSAMGGRHLYLHRLRPRSLVGLLLAAASALVGRNAFVGVRVLPTIDALKGAIGEVSRPAAATEEVVDTQESEAFAPAMRYIAMNRFQVRDGAEPQFEQRWATRQSSLLELDGFRWFALFRRIAAPGESSDYPDDYNYVSFTIWETKKNFNSWRKGPAFKEAHGGGNIFGFFSMIINGFMTSKGPPSPAFWKSLSVEKTAQAKERLISGPGGRPDADGIQKLDTEVSALMLRFAVPEGDEAKFEQTWMDERAKTFVKLKNEPGFRFGQLVRRDKTADDQVTYMAITMWDDMAHMEKWRNSKTAAKLMDAVDGITPMAYLYEGFLVLESETGA